MILLTLLPWPAAPAVPPADGFQLLLAIVGGGSIFAATASIVVAVITERGRRKDVAEQRVLQASKDLQEGETVREASYRDLAEQARKNAESAVAVIERSLASTQQLADRLQATVDSQTRTIDALTGAQVAQSDVIRNLTEDRDRLTAALEAARQKAIDEAADLADTRKKLQRANAELLMLDELLAATSAPAARRRPLLDTTGPIPTVKETPDGQA